VSLTEVHHCHSLLDHCLHSTAHQHCAELHCTRAAHTAAHGREEEREWVVTMAGAARHVWQQERECGSEQRELALLLCVSLV
jgi:hypothetical protein